MKTWTSSASLSIELLPLLGSPSFCRVVHKVWRRQLEVQTVRFPSPTFASRFFDLSVLTLSRVFALFSQVSVSKFFGVDRKLISWKNFNQMMLWRWEMSGKFFILYLNFNTFKYMTTSILQPVISEPARTEMKSTPSLSGHLRPSSLHNSSLKACTQGPLN